MPISATDLNKAYLAYFGRPADLTGKTYFATLEQADVIKAFDAVVTAFRFLEKRGANPLPIFPFDVRHRGQRISFDKLSTCLAAVREWPPAEE